MNQPVGFDPDRWQRAVAGSHRAVIRMEVWSGTEQLSENAPILSGTATEDWATGIRWHLNMTVPPTRAWLRWLSLPSLELRPYRGIRLSPSLTWMAPLGRYPLLPPELDRPYAPISISVSDYYQWVSTAKFPGPVMSYPGKITGAIIRVLSEAGLPGAEVRTGNQSAAGSVLIDKQRDEWVASAAKSISCEVFLDRDGKPVIADAVRLGTPTSKALMGSGGTAVGVKRSPDWSKVYNVVYASSSASDVDLPTERAAITLPSHPAHPNRLGSPSRPNYRVYLYSSPLLRSTAQIQQAARTILQRVSSMAEQYSYVCIPDPMRSASDTMLGATVDGGSQAVQIQTVSHPLTLEEDQQITAVSTRVDDE